MANLDEHFSCCLYFTAGKFFREISALAEESFSEIGLTPSYAFVLMVVHEEEEVSTSRVAEKVGLKPSTLTRLADKLVLKGYIERKQEGRNMFLLKTDKLESEMPRINQCWTNLFNAYNDILGKNNASEINQLLVTNNNKF